MDTRTRLDRDSSKPLYDQIKERLVGLIGEGRFALDGRIPSEERLAKIYGISRVTARLALQALGREIPLVRLKGKGTFLAATSSGRARRKIEYLRIIVPRPWSRGSANSGTFYFRIFQAVEEEARKSGIDVIFSAFNGDRKSVSAVEPTEGVLFVAVRSEEMLETLDRRGIPMALIDIGESEIPSISSFSVDSLRGARLGVSHLADMGHRRIALVTTPAETETGAFASRLRGYREVLAERGLPSPEAYVRRLAWDGPREEALAMVQDLLRMPEPPTAIFAAADEFSVRLLGGIHDAGLRIPDHISIASFGDGDAMRVACPPVTSVRLFEEEMGRQAVRHILTQAEMPEVPGVRRTVLSELVVRQSVRRLET